MFGDTGNLPVTGGIFLVAALYAGVSIFVTGPLVGERMVAKLDWAEQCAGHIRAGVEAEQPDVSSFPKVGCNEMFGMFFGAEGERFCAKHGDAFANNPLNRTLGAAENAKREAQRKRIEYAVARATSRCDCAVTTTLENRRIPLAIHAGSARLITPPSVRLLESDLESALNSAACAMKG